MRRAMHTHRVMLAHRAMLMHRAILTHQAVLTHQAMLTHRTTLMLTLRVIFVLQVMPAPRTPLNRRLTMITVLAVSPIRVVQVALNLLTCFRQSSRLEVGLMARRHQERPTILVHLAFLEGPLYQFLAHSSAPHLHKLNHSSTQAIIKTADPTRLSHALHASDRRKLFWPGSITRSTETTDSGSSGVFVTRKRWRVFFKNTLVSTRIIYEF